jgi:hypothetical protein
MRPEVVLGTERYTDSPVVVLDEGASVVLRPNVSDILSYGTWQWSDGSTEPALRLDSVSTSGEYTVFYTLDGSTTGLTYYVYVHEGPKDFRSYGSGNYLIRHRYTDTYLTNSGQTDVPALLAPLQANADSTEVHSTQVWQLEFKTGRYNFISLYDGLYLNKEGLMKATTLRPFRIKGAKDSDWLCIQNNATSGNICWVVSDGGVIDFAGSETPIDYPFELVAADGITLGVSSITAATLLAEHYYSLDGVELDTPQRGIVLCRRIWSDGNVTVEKLLVK